MGINRAFDAEKVDLSGIAGKKGELEVSSVVQKTFIDVCEEGIEAAAATAVRKWSPFFVGFFTHKSQFTDVPTVVSALVEEPEAKIFNADHPFIFYVKVKGVVLFGGRVVEPKL